MERKLNTTQEVFVFLSKVSWVTLLCALVFEGFFPGYITVQVKLAFFLWIAILLTVAVYVARSLSRSRTSIIR